MKSARVLLISVVAGVVLFLWGALSHMLLPFYNDALLRFTDEAATTQWLSSNAPVSGMYFLPYEPESRDASGRESFMRRMQEGPFMLASVRVGPMKPFGVSMATQLMTDILTAFFVTLLVWRVRHLSFKARLGHVLVISAVLLCASHLPFWNWYEFSTAFTIAESADQIVGLFCAGLVISRMVPTGTSPA